MSFPKRPTLALAGFLLILETLPLSAQSARLKLDQLERLAGAASEVVDVTLDGSTLQMATKFMEKDPKTLALVRNLQGIYVKSFEFDRPEAYTSADLDAIHAQLQPPGWSRIVNVQSRKEGHVEVFLMGDGRGGSLGLAVLAAEPKELTVVNILGPIDLQSLGSLEGQLGIPRLGTGKADEKREEKPGGRHEAK
ncbi:MAG TPA: DUF4252 domain-containing protein [Holophagaceae bacterium]